MGRVTIMPVLIQNRQRTVTIRTKWIKQRVQQILLYLGYANHELSIVFANDKLVQVLNHTYRHQDRPTNVLAFPQTPSPPDTLATVLLGDIVISLPAAAREAQVVHQSLEERVLYLVIHALLHLIGFDHERSLVERRRMAAKEREVLTYLRSRGLKHA